VYKKQLAWLAFESPADMFQKYPECNAIFAEEFKGFKIDYLGLTDNKDMTEEDLMEVFLEDHLREQNDDPYDIFGEHLIKRKGYKAAMVEVHYFNEEIEDDGVAKYVVEVFQIVPQTPEDLVELIEVYCEKNNKPLPEVLIEKLVPQ